MDLLDIFIIALVFAVIILLILIFWIRIKVPRIVHTVLPPYEVPDLIAIGGVIVENRGRALAQNVIVTCKFPDGSIEKIRNLHIVSDAKYVLRDGGEEKSFLTLRIRRLVPGQNLIVYFSGSNRNQPQVNVTYDGET